MKYAKCPCCGALRGMGSLDGLALQPFDPSWLRTPPLRLPGQGLPPSPRDYIPVFTPEGPR